VGVGGERGDWRGGCCAYLAEWDRSTPAHVHLVSRCRPTEGLLLLNDTLDLHRHPGLARLSP